MKRRGRKLTALVLFDEAYDPSRLYSEIHNAIARIPGVITVLSVELDQNATEISDSERAFYCCTDHGEP